MKFLFSVVIFLLFDLHPSFAQSANDSSKVNIALNNAVAFSNNTLRENIALFNGKEYVTSDMRIQGHPCFEYEDMETGTVTYYGQTFTNVPLLYDIYTDEVITELYNSVYDLCLNSRKVSGFSLANNNFIRIENDSLLSSLPKPGFYQMLYEGNTKVFAKRRKIIFEEIVDRRVHREYQSVNSYFIQIGKDYHQVKSKKSALSLFADHKKEINRSLRKNKIKFRKNKELALVAMAEEFDKLSK